jgi:hypothetical protein
MVDRLDADFSIMPAGTRSISRRGIPGGQDHCCGKTPRSRGSGGTDEALKGGSHEYDVSIQVGDTVYVCRHHAHAGQEISWLQDKQASVRIKGKVMYVKRVTGKDAKASIVRTNKADHS